MPRNRNDTLIIHVGEHGSQNTIVHVKKPTVFFSKKYPYTKKMYTEKINNNENLIEFFALARSQAFFSHSHTVKRIKRNNMSGKNQKCLLA